MPFGKDIRIAALTACQRHCCLCTELKHTRIACHHIVQEADGGPNTLDNCIPLCPDCHAEVKAFDPRHHPGMTSYSKEELVRRRDDFYAIIARRSEDLASRLHNLDASIPRKKALQGEIEFDYADHDGQYVVGEGLSEFMLRWNRCGEQAIYGVSYNTNIAIATPPKNIELVEIEDAGIYNFSSSVRRVSLGGLMIAQNHTGRYAAIKILSLETSVKGLRDLARMAYWILDDGSVDFSKKA